MNLSYQDRNVISDIIENTSTSLFNAIKYIYIIGENDFYNISAKDIFKVALSDVTNTEILANLNIALDNERLGEMSAPEFKRIKGIIHYAFIIRLPFLKRIMDNCPLSENQMRELYGLAVKRGAENYGEVIDGDFRSMMKIVKNKQNEPSFDSEWFRRWVYTSGHELAAINNRNMFLFGCIDAMFPLFYSALTERISSALVMLQNAPKN